MKKHLFYLFTNLKAISLKSNVHETWKWQLKKSIDFTTRVNDRFCVKRGDKRRSTLDSEDDKELKESNIPKSLDQYIKEKGKERGRFYKPKFLQNANKSSKSNQKALNSCAEVFINVSLIEANEKGIVSIKRGRKSWSYKNFKKVLVDRSG